MRQGVAAALVLAGALLALLGAVGLVRFPDFFSRAHAAAKAATLGVILATAAAVVAAGSAGDAAILTLVMLLLFLTGPAATTLLARSAYHDPDTPRLLGGGDELAGRKAEEAPFPERPGSTALLALWLAAAWLAFWGAAEPGVALAAVALGATLARLLPGYRPRWPRGVLHPAAALGWAAHLGRMVITSTWQVTRAVVSPRRRLRTAVVRVPLRVRTATEVTLLMNSVTFSPGTMALEVEAGCLFVHVLHLESPEAFVAEVRSLEEHIITAFGTPEERAGGR
ncbi:MAG: Na+/H+ antiporter subunit E [Acidimicrobiia bacterium]|nr:Na+/H+ antiporter subunit E [Acidimicrobiia bacterium]